MFHHSCIESQKHPGWTWICRALWRKRKRILLKGGGCKRRNTTHPRTFAEVRGKKMAQERPAERDSDACTSTVPRYRGGMVKQETSR